MRATLGRIAVVMLVTSGLTGCTSGSGMLAWFKKKPSNTALSEAPKYSAPTSSSASLPSTGQNPNSSLAQVSNSSWSTTTAPGSTAAATSPYSQYSAPASGAQPASYPSTAYGPAKLTPATPQASATPWGATAPASNNGGFATSGAVSAGVSSNGYGMSAATAPTAYSNPTTVATANTTQNSTTGGVQPQSGYYNPAYEGGTANRYASGAAIPGMVPSTVSAQTAPGNNPNSSYYTADARNSMSGAANGNASAYAGAHTAGGYAGSTTPTAGAGGYQSQNYSSTAGGYSPGNTGYQPGATSNPPGNTGYNPTDVYSTPATAANPAAAMPARSDSEYRPGGTGNYAPSASGVQPATNGSQDNRAVNSGVMPASYQAPVASSTTSAGGEVYGAYQGATPSKEPAYGASNPNSTAAATSPTRTW